MNNVIYEYISKELRNVKQSRYVSDSEIKNLYITLVYLKYLCDKYPNEYNYEIDMEGFISKIKEEKNIDLNNILEKKININKLLNSLKYENVEELINDLKLEYIEDNEIVKILINPNDKVLHISNRLLKNNYIDIGGITYVSEVNEFNMKSNHKYNMIFDELFGFDNTYIETLDDVDINNYDIIYIHDMEPAYKYAYREKNEMDLIDSIIKKYKFEGKIILRTRYAKVSIFREKYLIENHLSKVILNSEKSIEDTFLEFTNGEKPKKISIILYNKNEKLDYEKIIVSNRENKKCLIKILPVDIINNNYRIGFSMYKDEQKIKVTNITSIIKENTEIIDRIKYLNDDISKEIDKLFVK